MQHDRVPFKLITQSLCYTTLVLTYFFLPIDVTMTNIFLVMTIILSVVAGDWRLKWQRVKNNPMLWLWILFLIIILLSMSYSLAPARDQLTALHKNGKIIFLIFLMPLLFSSTIKRLALLAFNSAMFVTLMVVYLKYFGLIDIGNAGDNTDIFLNHIQTTFLMGFFFYFVLQNCQSTVRGCWFYRVLVVLISIAILFMSFSRIGYIVYFAMLGLYVLQHCKIKGILVAFVASCSLVFTAYCFSPQFHLSVNNSFYSKSQNSSLNLRLDYLKNSKQLIEQHPWFGTGAGSFKSLYYQQFGTVPLPHESHLRTPHNQLIMFMVELGALGLFFFLLILVMQWRYAAHLAKDKSSFAQALVLLFFIGCLCDALFFASATGYFYVLMTALYYADLPRQFNEKDLGSMACKPKFFTA